MRRDKVAAATLLRLCVRDATAAVRAERRRLFAAVDTEPLVEAAVLHRVIGYVLEAAREDGAAPDLVDALHPLARGAVGGHLRALGDVAAVDRALQDRIEWLVVKGPVLAGHYYPRPDLRSYVDVDVLVRPEDLGRSLELLEGAGFVVLDRNWDMFVREMPGEVHLRSPFGGVVDLHWHLQNDRRARDAATISTADLLARRRTVRVGQGEVPTLSGQDTLLHLCLHAARSGGNRLVWLTDIREVWRRERLDVAALREGAESWGVELPLLVMLERGRRVLADPDLGAGYPALARVPRGWRLVAAAVDKVAPVHQAGQGSSLSRVVARAVATAPRNAAREGLRRSTHHLQHLREGQTDRTWDPADPDSVTFDAGGPAARQRYLRAVADVARQGD